jgi:non-homologous end joining protein Ku
MPALGHVYWRGFLRLQLVSITVDIYSAAESASKGREHLAVISPVEEKGFAAQCRPLRFKDSYAVELRKLVEKEAKGHKIEVPKLERAPASNVVNLMDNLKKSLGKGKEAEAEAKPKRKSAK